MPNPTHRGPHVDVLIVLGVILPALKVARQLVALVIDLKKLLKGK